MSDDQCRHLHIPANGTSACGAEGDNDPGQQASRPSNAEGAIDGAVRWSAVGIGNGLRRRRQRTSVMRCEQFPGRDNVVCRPAKTQGEGAKPLRPGVMRAGNRGRLGYPGCREVAAGVRCSGSRSEPHVACGRDGDGDGQKQNTRNLMTLHK
jgi:hypothetical protein